MAKRNRKPVTKVEDNFEEEFEEEFEEDFEEEEDFEDPEPPKRKSKKEPKKSLIQKVKENKVVMTVLKVTALVGAAGAGYAIGHFTGRSDDDQACSGYLDDYGYGTDISESNIDTELEELTRLEQES